MRLKHLAIATLAVCSLLKATVPDAEEKLKADVQCEPAATGRIDIQLALTEATNYWRSHLKR
jgi:hypothetical protein